ncbi:zinc transporter 8-like [Amaranthus tricolor]|uniref:zinc transporter 8-like n=1 Tax=Amaranthus tricolor TaxID=29722 RepID=UPI002589D7CC|nr:zinc transporter 8-like [Amaranthus tricolor]
MLFDRRKSILILFSIVFLLFRASLVAGECTCDSEEKRDSNKHTLKYKIGALVIILVSSGCGVCLPILGRHFSAFHPQSNIFFLVKSFAAGVILSTGFIHVLPDAFESLTSPCLKENPWANFPFTGLAAMLGSIGCLIIDAFATGHYGKLHSKTGAVDEEHSGHVHLHTHATHGHAHGSGPDATPQGLTELERIRYKVTSQVLEMGIVVHSVIIGIALGTSQDVESIKPLMAALCFHQFFEGVGLGGCIVQASFKSASMMCMALFFSLTTPVGIAIGIGITNVYDESSPTALIVQGLLDAVAAGILIYMALVDLLAQDFMNPRVHNNNTLFFGANVSLLLGAAFMAVLAIWA